MKTVFNSLLIEHLAVRVEDRKIDVRVLSAHEKTNANPLLLLTFATDRHTSLHVEPYNGAANFFIDHGHRVASFSLPQHGERVDEFGEGIVGLRNALVGGNNRFGEFLREASAVIDECIARGWAEPGRIVVAGTSRAGYLALRLLASDSRIAGACAFAPVTDWHRLDEFGGDTERADITALGLSNFVDGMVGKPVFIVIGNHDARVGTDACCRFYVALREANIRGNHGDLHLNFQVQDTPGHNSTTDWQEAGASFLMAKFEA